jgi:hypothetical protein
MGRPMTLVEIVNRLLNQLHGGKYRVFRQETLDKISQVNQHIYDGTDSGFDRTIQRAIAQVSTISGLLYAGDYINLQLHSHNLIPTGTERYECIHYSQHSALCIIRRHYPVVQIPNSGVYPDQHQFG